MPLYTYHALSSKGKRRKGIVDATSLREAKEKLREQGVMVTLLAAGKGRGHRFQLTGQHLVTFTTQLSQLIRSGMPVFESLLALEEQYREEKFHRVILSLCDQIRSGTALSAAMRQHPESFNTLYCAMVAAGESSGSLDQVLEKLSLLLAKSMKVKKQLLTSLTYPIVIASFCCVVIFLLLTFAIPSIEALFEGKSLNSFTHGVLAVSHFLSSYWFLYLPLTAGLITGLLFFFKSPKGKLFWGETSLKLPLIKGVVIESSLVRFARTFATLQEGGVTIIDALRLSQKVMTNPVLEKIISDAEGQIIEGSLLSAELKKEPLIPKMVVRMLSVGEETGNLAAMLHQIADLYESELENKLTRLTALAQPAILIIMGGIVGLIMLAVLLPLTDVTSLI